MYCVGGSKEKHQHARTESNHGLTNNSHRRLLSHTEYFYEPHINLGQYFGCEEFSVKYCYLRWTNSSNQLTNYLLRY